LLSNKGRQPTYFEEKSMRKMMSSMLAAVLSVSFIGAEMATASAAPLYVPQAPTASSDVQTVAGRGEGLEWKRHNQRQFRGDRQFRSERQFRGERHGYWNGHRGYRDYRRGYKRHGDMWFPLAAFATGAIISGAIANDRPPAYRGNSHVEYCYNRYKSYRASDNTFQPYNGPRQQCR
jgi:hypothetical protein